MNIELTTDFSAVPDSFFKYAILVARFQGQFVFVRHRERQTLELPAGHREPGEAIQTTAARELREETGAMDFDLQPVFVFRVPAYDAHGQRTDEVASLVCFAEIRTLGPLDPAFEIAQIQLCPELPEHLTYPEIQPVVFRRVREWLAGQTPLETEGMSNVTKHEKVGEPS
ncbi:MAG: NUDIX domain-containing protein [Eubacteriales bacterium]|nr:NUDIX domain-containing protein [Eubacteriales bacterium]